MAKLFRQILLLKEQPSLGKAIEMLDLEFDGVPHTALNDAINTARVHAALLRRMRREPDPVSLPAIQTVNVDAPSDFAARLAKCLGNS